MDRSDPGARQHGDHSLGDHGHINSHNVATVHVLTAQCVGELADFGVQFAVGDFTVLGRIVTFPDDRNAVAALFQMTVQAVVGHVQRAVGEPFDVDAVIVEGSLFDVCEGFDPVEALGLLTPETIGVDHRLLVHGLVGCLIRQRVRCDFWADGVQGSCTHLGYLGG